MSIPIVTGCASLLPEPAPPPDYYVLTAIPEAESARPAGKAHSGPVVGVAPVNLPDYLNVPEIVVRSTRNTLDKAYLHNWGSPLADNFASVLAENLGVMIPTNAVTVLPSRPFFRPDFQVSVDLSKFERDAEGLVTLIARWALLGEDGQKLIAMQRSVFQQPAPAGDYDAIAAALSTAVAQLSEEIASAIRSRSDLRLSSRATVGPSP
ncbi:MAG: PqiC family protein [Hyphomicrobium sp.]